MAEVLRFTVPESELHPAMGQLIRTLLRKEKGYRLPSRQPLVGPEGIRVPARIPENDPEPLRGGIGEVWISPTKRRMPAGRSTSGSRRKRKGRSRIFIPPGVLAQDTRLVLTNAIYFKGNWQEQFDKEATQDAPFHVSADKEVTVPMMHQIERFGYRATEDMQILELPYAKNALSMVVLLPQGKEGWLIGEEAHSRRSSRLGPGDCGLRK